MTFIDGHHHFNQDGMLAYFVALLCKGVFQLVIGLNPICCSVSLASCCSGRVSSQYLTSMR